MVDLVLNHRSAVLYLLSNHPFNHTGRSSSRNFIFHNSIYLLSWSLLFLFLSIRTPLPPYFYSLLALDSILIISFLYSCPFLSLVHRHLSFLYSYHLSQIPLHPPSHTSTCFILSLLHILLSFLYISTFTLVLSFSFSIFSSSFLSLQFFFSLPAPYLGSFLYTCFFLHHHLSFLNCILSYPFPTPPSLHLSFLHTSSCSILSPPHLHPPFSTLHLVLSFPHPIFILLSPHFILFYPFSTPSSSFLSPHFILFYPFSSPSSSFLSPHFLLFSPFSTPSSSFLSPHFLLFFPFPTSSKPSLYLHFTLFYFLKI